MPVAVPVPSNTSKAGVFVPVRVVLYLDLMISLSFVHMDLDLLTVERISMSALEMFASKKI